MSVYESDLEKACLGWFAQLGYEVLPSDHLDPDDVYRERASYEEVILDRRLRTVLEELNPEATADALDEAVRRIRRHDAPTLEQNNLDFHRMLTDGVTVEVASEHGGVRGQRIRLFDFDEPGRNEYVASHQVTVVDPAGGTGQPRRPDIVVWVNGLPLAVIELKNPASAQADIWTAFNQIQNYKRDIPSLFATNELVVISDDVLSRVGSLTAGTSRFQPWRAVRDERDLRVPAETAEVLDRGERLQALVEGIFEPSRLLDLLRHFVTFEEEEGRLVKKIAAYHQFHAVRAAVDQTVRATSGDGDRRIGVVWHTQGSGKSLTMVFFAGKLIASPEMENPTLVVLTDRNDLDDQLFGVFSHSEALLRQKPVQAQDRDHLRELLKTVSGGVYFTTVQKFLPPDGKAAQPLSDRRNIVVIADEAHRSQYGFKGRLDTRRGEIVYGFAKHMRDALPAASFVGFTGTPVELEDKDTVEVFGDYISIYDIRRAVEDGATVPIYYENRLANLELDESERPHIDPRFEEVTEGEEDSVKEGLKSQWSTLEVLVGSEKRVHAIARDLLEHFDRRNQVMAGGKAMVVCMSRRICVALHEEIARLRPEWIADDDDQGRVKVVMTGGASDAPEIAKHARTKARRELLALRFKDPNDPFHVVIVRDMWLTGFDAPCLHTLYVDKPMRGHNLMQAIARVNRVFGDKPGGLVVDYLGIAAFLKEAMLTYTRSGGEGDATERQEKALALMQEKLELCRDLFHGFSYEDFFGEDVARRLELLPAAREHVLRQRTGVHGDGKSGVLDGYDRFLKTVSELSKAAALVASTPEFEAARDEIAFFQAVKAGLVKLSPGRKRPTSDLGHAVRQIVANAIVSDEVVDVFAAAGLAKPDLSVLSDEFLAEIQGMEHKNLAAAVLERLLRDQISAHRRKSIVQARSFEQMLEDAVSKYLSRSIEATEVIQRLLELAREFNRAGAAAKELGLTEEEHAFYEALAQNQSARDVLGDKVLTKMAHELTRLVRQNASIDWTKKRTVQAKLRTLVKRLLRKYKYPPDGEKSATESVLEQAKQLGINVTDGSSDTEADPGSWASGPPESVRPGTFPYPIAVFDSLVASQPTGAVRVKTRMDGIERALTFLVACELAWLRESNGDAYTAQVRKILGADLGKPVSMGTWLEYAWRLAALMPSTSVDPVVVAGRAFVNDKNKPSELTQLLQRDVVPYRNTFSHGVVPAEEEVARHERPLNEAWKQVESALAPFMKTKLISPVKILDFEEDGSGAHYQVRDHSGAQGIFPLKEIRVQGKLREPWTYLLRDSGRPLPLSPVVACRYLQTAGRHEVFFARTLAIEPGAKVEAMAVTSDAKEKLEIK